MKKMKVLCLKNVLPGTDKAVFWKCEKGHSWSAYIYQRTGKNKSGCPFCSHLKVTDETSLATLKPYVVSYWDERKSDCLPTDVLANSNKDFWWKCEMGHSWVKKPNAITERAIKKFCPFCNGRKLNEENNMKIRFPIIACEWDKEKNEGMDPMELLPNNTNRVWWKCEKGHSYLAKISDRCFKGKSCTKCARYHASKEYNLKTQYPQVVKEWDYSRNGHQKPEEFLPFSGEKIWWKCEKGHTWREIINKRTARRYGCPYCSGTRVTSENCLATLRPDIARNWDYDKNDITPEEVSLKSGKRIYWKCRQGHTWDGTICNTVKYSVPCRLCRKVEKDKKKKNQNKLK